MLNWEVDMEERVTELLLAGLEVWLLSDCDTESCNIYKSIRNHYSCNTTISSAVRHKTPASRQQSAF